MQPRQQYFEPGSTFGYRQWTLLVLGLATLCLLVLGSQAFLNRHGATTAPEPDPESAPAGAPLSHKAILVAGDTVTLGADSVPVRRLPAQEMNSRLAWTQGLIQLDGKTLTEAVAEFNRYNRRKLTIVDPAIAGLQVSGTFPAAEPERFVATLARSAGIRALTAGSHAADSQVIRLVGAKVER